MAILQDALRLLERGENQFAFCAALGADGKSVTLDSGRQGFLSRRQIDQGRNRLGGRRIRDCRLDERAVLGVGLKKTKPPVDLKHGEPEALLGERPEDPHRHGLCSFCGIRIQTVKDKCDQVLRSRIGGDKAKRGEMNRRSSVGHRQLRGHEIDDRLIVFGSDCHVQ